MAAHGGRTVVDAIQKSVLSPVPAMFFTPRVRAKPVSKMDLVTTAIVKTSAAALIHDGMDRKTISMGPDAPQSVGRGNHSQPLPR
jgi:hypothetical protein